MVVAVLFVKIKKCSWWRYTHRFCSLPTKLVAWACPLSQKSLSTNLCWITFMIMLQY